MVAELKLLGNDIVCGVSSGLAPFGIIDDVNTRAFTQPKIDEVVFIGPELIGTPVIVAGQPPRTSHEVMVELQEPNIVKSSFVSDYPLVVSFKNGTVRAPINSELNYDSDGDGVLDSIRAVVSYIYQVPDVPGDNTTLGSGRVTIWMQRAIWQTDQYDSTQGYPLNATLYCGLDGRLTTRQPTPQHPGIAIVLGPPTSISTMLEFMWL